LTRKAPRCSYGVEDESLLLFLLSSLLALIIAVFTALHAMQTRSTDENSVRLSVRPSVRHTHAL